ncbi:MAG: GAP family protein [Actinomycetota bacterium]
MIDVLLDALPLALGAALSPTILIVTVLMLASPREARLRALLFTLGCAIVIVALGLIGLAVIGSVAKPDPGAKDTLKGWIDLAAGIVLAVFGVRLLLVKKRTRNEVTADEQAKEPAKARPVWQAVPLGAAMMLLNTSSLALYVPILKELAHADLRPSGRLIVLAIVDAIILLPALIPIALTLVAPKTAARALASVQRLATRYARRLSGAIFAALGLYLVYRGIDGL